MSESREHKRRYNQKLQFIATFEKWLSEEPNMLHFFKWRKWKKDKPTFGKGGADNG